MFSNKFLTLKLFLSFFLGSFSFYGCIVGTLKLLTLTLVELTFLKENKSRARAELSVAFLLVSLHSAVPLLSFWNVAGHSEDGHPQEAWRFSLVLFK